MVFPRRISTASKAHTAEETVAKLRQVDVLCGQGNALADAIRAIGVMEVTTTGGGTSTVA